MGGKGGKGNGGKGRAMEKRREGKGEEERYRK